MITAFQAGVPKGLVVRRGLSAPERPEAALRGRRTARKGTVLDRKAVGAPQKDSALQLTAAASSPTAVVMTACGSAPSL
eukprot:SAG22_NODE_727_length_7598_cov_89.922523_4_plen_79_part_00